ncbi:cytochrome P450 [Aspergillus foveolatus]|uniref:cytochrome P450 n=1 Tax=Aspergillus foveolatus TaxID=210207 RepID=UPI003CCDF426
MKLGGEIRSAFHFYDEINVLSTSPLKYLQAVILEGLRIYPPLPFALPRVVPQGGDTVDGHFLPAGTIVSTNPLAASLDAANFEAPYDFKPERWLEKMNRLFWTPANRSPWGLAAAWAASKGPFSSFPSLCYNVNAYP